MPPKKKQQRLTHRQQTIRDGFLTLGITDGSVFDNCEGDRDNEFKVIKKSYHKACLQHHPDKGGNAETFRNIHSSFELLKDLHKGVVVQSKKKKKNGTDWLFSECFQSAEASAAAAVAEKNDDQNDGAASNKDEGDDDDDEAFDMSDYDDQFAKMATPSWEYCTLILFFFSHAIIFHHFFPINYCLYLLPPPSLTK